VHLYEAVPKRSVATLAGLKPPYHKRFFARLVSTTITDHIPSEFERLMVEVRATGVRDGREGGRESWLGFFFALPLVP